MKQDEVFEALSVLDCPRLCGQGSLQKKKKCVTNVTLAPPKCDKKPSGLFGQKWPFQEVKFLDFNHAIICQSLQSVSQLHFEGFPQCVGGPC